MKNMKDIQNCVDTRNVPIKKVGIKDLRYPIKVLDKSSSLQPTVAKINMYVDLPHNHKGTHMSRFLEILNQYHGKIAVVELGGMLKKMQEHLDAETAHLEMSFPYFITKQAPVSKAEAVMDYQCSFEASRSGKVFDLVSQVAVPVTMLCPCSKEISEYGAHNQRSTVTVSIRTKSLVWFEEIIDIIEANASSPVYSLLKRSDEKAVTEAAYNHAAFAEDVVRDIAVILNNDSRILWYKVETENMESIHNHNAYAMVESEGQ
jgi:GTP cyclohydrolase I